MRISLHDRIECAVCNQEWSVRDLLNISIHNDYALASLGDDYVGDCPGCQEMLYVEDII